MKPTIVDDAEEDGDESPTAFDVAGVEKLVASFVKKSTWVRGVTLSLGSGMSWAPSAVSKDQAEIAHFHFANTLRPYLAERIRAASRAGKIVHLVAPLAALFDPEVLEVLADVDGFVHVFDKNCICKALHHLDAIGKFRVGVSPQIRTKLANACWARRSQGNNNQKGRRFEMLLAFLFEQVRDFTVVVRNYRGDTDEIDLVLQIDNWSKRCWQYGSVPFLLVEAKNRKETTGQAVVSLLVHKLRSKRGTARIGFVFTCSSFSSDAQVEVAKTASTELAVVLAGPKEIKEWINSDESDDYLEGLVRDAMLR